jgi:hypothetical protein
MLLSSCALPQEDADNDGAHTDKISTAAENTVPDGSGSDKVPATEGNAGTEPAPNEDGDVKTTPSDATEPDVQTEVPVTSVTEEPVITDAPAITDEPVKTTAPMVPTGPYVTEKPVITTEPPVTDIPAVTTGPKEITEPAVTTGPDIELPEIPINKETVLESVKRNVYVMVGNEDVVMPLRISVVKFSNGTQTIDLDLETDGGDVKLYRMFGIGFITADEFVTGADTDNPHIKTVITVISYETSVQGRWHYLSGNHRVFKIADSDINGSPTGAIGAQVEYRNSLVPTDIVIGDESCFIFIWRCREKAPIGQELIARSLLDGYMIYGDGSAVLDESVFDSYFPKDGSLLNFYFPE